MLLQMTRPVQGGLRQQRKLDVIANNLANTDTPGFKGDILSFDDTLKATRTIDFTQGPLRQTGNKLDVAIQGEGFFQVLTPQGIRYTRDGNFTLDSNGEIITQQGFPVMGDGGPIAIPITGNDIGISQTGDIEVDGATIDRFKVVTFADLNKLDKQGNSLFVYQGPQTDQRPATQATVHQGALEQPNTAVVKEMSKMVETMRLFEAYQKVIQSFDETDTKAINEIGLVQ
jgi:flagellar basal-body rod protein FlgF